MDGERFDAMTRALTAATTRRRALRLLGGTVLGTLVAGVTRPAQALAACSVDADCPNGGNPCTADLCQDGRCVHPPLPDGTVCPDGGNPCTADYCQAGMCIHPPKADGESCGDGRICTSGHCCLAGTTFCADTGRCVNLRRDPYNCGRCGKHCAAGRICRRGSCKLA